MEHNEYSVYTVKCRGTKGTGYFKDQEYVNTGDVVNEYEKTVIAPSDEKIAIRLIEYSLSNKDLDKAFKILSFEKKSIDSIIRFEDAYRARL